MKRYVPILAILVVVLFASDGWAPPPSGGGGSGIPIRKVQDLLDVTKPLSPANGEGLLYGTGANKFFATDIQTAVEAAAQDSAFYDSSETAKFTDLIVKGPWIDVRAYASSGTGASDDPYLGASGQGGIGEAIAANPGGRMVFYIPSGFYYATTTIPIREDGLRVVGDGIDTTVINYEPDTAGTPLFHVWDWESASPGDGHVLYKTGLSGFTIYGYGDDAKVGIRVTDIGYGLFEHIQIRGFATTGSIGLQLRGRDTMEFRDMLLNADQPVSIEDNPASTIDFDGSHFEDINYLIQGDGNHAILIADGVNLTNITWDGRQSAQLGSGFLKWIDTTSSQASANLVIRNVKYEQATDPTAFVINIQHNFGLNSLMIDNVMFGSDQNEGLRLRKANYVTVQNSVFEQAGGRITWDLDATYPFVSIGNVIKDPATRTIANMQIVKRVTGFGHWAGFEVYDSSSMTASENVFDYNGKLSIATTSTTARLNVATGNVLLDNTYAYQIKNSAGGANNVLAMSSDNDITILAGAGGDLAFYHDGGNDGAALYIKDSTGHSRIGIENNAPGAILQIDSPAADEKILILKLQ